MHIYAFYDGKLGLSIFRRKTLPLLVSLLRVFTSLNHNGLEHLRLPHRTDLFQLSVMVLPLFNCLMLYLSMATLPIYLDHTMDIPLSCITHHLLNIQPMILTLYFHMCHVLKLHPHCLIILALYHCLHSRWPYHALYCWINSVKLMRLMTMIRLDWSNWNSFQVTAMLLDLSMKIGMDMQGFLGSLGMTFYKSINNSLLTWRAVCGPQACSSIVFLVQFSCLIQASTFWLFPLCYLFHM